MSLLFLFKKKFEQTFFASELVELTFLKYFTRISICFFRFFSLITNAIRLIVEVWDVVALALRVPMIHSSWFVAVDRREPPCRGNTNLVLMTSLPITTTGWARFVWSVLVMTVTSQNRQVQSSGIFCLFCKGGDEWFTRHESCDGLFLLLLTQFILLFHKKKIPRKLFVDTPKNRSWYRLSGMSCFGTAGYRQPVECCSHDASDNDEPCGK